MNNQVAGPDGLGPLPETEWLLFMPARPYEREWVSNQPGYAEEQLRAYAEAAAAAERKRCAKLCETWMEAVERESGPEAAGWLHQMAQHMRSA